MADTPRDREQDMAKYFVVRPYGVTSSKGTGPNYSCTTNPVTPLTDVTVPDGLKAVKDAIVKYGGGISATPQLDGSATTVGPFGNPPTEPTKSGGAWVPLMVNGNWQWFDPEVAKAIAAENAAIARLGEAQARPVQSQAQLDVYALDPAYKDAMNAAKSTLDKALAPYRQRSRTTALPSNSWRRYDRRSALLGYPRCRTISQMPT